MGNREAIQPRKSYRAEADTFFLVAGSKNWTISESKEIPPGSIERGERAKGVSAYLGGLTGSER